MALWREVGMSPILVKKEVAGFVLNRLQYALVAEAFRLVEVNLIYSFSPRTIESQFEIVILLIKLELEVLKKAFE